MAAAILAVLGAACSDVPSAPRSGTVRVTVRTSGGDPDFDGYEVVVDPARRSVEGNGTAEFRYIGVGTHSVALEGVADNCSVVGTSSRSVSIERDKVVNVSFDVECATTGIAVTTKASGVNMPDSVDVFVDGEAFSPAPASGLTVVSRLQPGKYTVTLALRGTNCSVAGGNEVTVDVPARTVTSVLFALTCAAPVRSEKIAFTVDTTNRGAPETLIEVVNPDGSGGRVIGRGRSPSWSPDGTRVAFSDVRCGPGEDGGLGCFGGLIVMDPELGSLTRPLYGNQGLSPAWAPARDTIAFAGCCDTALEPNRLFIVGLGDSPAREVVLPGVPLIRHPVWSPDGRRIAFTCVVVEGSPRDQFTDDLCVVDRDGSNFERLTADPGSESDPAWSPDGRRIAFTQGADISLLKLDDGVVTRLTEGREPAWSPDGSTLVFAGGDGLFTIRADGSNRRRLTSGVHRAPAWRP
jgi:hypothetical protein